MIVNATVATCGQLYCLRCLTKCIEEGSTFAKSRISNQPITKFQNLEQYLSKLRNIYQDMHSFVVPENIECVTPAMVPEQQVITPAMVSEQQPITPAMVSEQEPNLKINRVKNPKRSSIARQEAITYPLK